MPNLIDLRMRDLRRGLSSAASPSAGSAVAAKAKPLAFPKSRRLMVGSLIALNKRREARLGQGRRRVLAGLPVHVFRVAILLRAEYLLVGNFLAGVGGSSAHDRHHRAERHAVTVVDRLAGADRLEQFVVLDLVHIFLFLPS